MANWWVAAAAAGGFAGVALGAAGTHAAGDAQAAEWLDLASRFLLIHSTVLLALGLAWPAPSRLLTAACGLFLAGMVLFAGGLTFLALTGSPIGRLSTPVGGTTLLLGWLVLAAYGVSARSSA